jgi:hypothetical protein
VEIVYFASFLLLTYCFFVASHFGSRVFCFVLGSSLCWLDYRFLIYKLFLIGFIFYTVPAV